MKRTTESSNKEECMIILHPESLEAAVEMKRQFPQSSYLSGGTALLSLLSGKDKDSCFIDISKILSAEIRKEGDGVRIGGAAKLADIARSEILPEFIRKSAGFQSSLQLREQATIGGNVALARFDSYMIPSLFASDAVLSLISADGRRDLQVDEYVLSGDKDSIIESVYIRSLSDGEAKRFARASHAHAALTAAHSGKRYAYGISGSGFAFGDKDSYSTVDFSTDLTGSGDYKRYLASVSFKEVR